MNQIESGYENEQQEKTKKDIAKKGEVEAVEREGHGTTETEVDSAERSLQGTAENDIATQDELNAVETEGQGESAKELVKPAEVDLAEKLRHGTLKKELATQEEVGSVEPWCSLKVYVSFPCSCFGFGY